MTAILQRSFAGGEISPSLYPRVDQNKYAFGLRTARNGFIRKNGGFSNRPGMKHVTGLALGSGYNYRLVPWESSVSDQTYILVFANNEITFIQNGSLVRLTSAAPAYSNVTAYVPGDLVLSAGTTYYCKAPTTGNAPPNAAYWHQLFADSQGVIYAIPTIFTTPDAIKEFQFAQDANQMLLTHFRTLPANLIRRQHLNWVIENWQTDSSFFPARYGLPAIEKPTGLTASGGGSGGASYVVTAVADENFEESLPSAVANTATVPSIGTPVNLSWTAVTGAYGYNVYRQYFGLYKFIYFVSSNSFQDTGYAAAADADTPPETRPEFQGVTGQFPWKCGVYQQRTLLGNFDFNVQAAYASKVGVQQNFTRKFPAADDDSFQFQIRGKRINGIRHFIDLGALVLLTDSGEWIVKGDVNGVVKPDAINPEQYSYNGANDVPPIIIGSDALYIQRQGSIVRALGFDSISGGRDGYRDADLTLFADHLFEGKSITHWAFQQTPHSIVWAVRSDGVLLGLTYIKDQQILAWHRHDTDGEFLDVAAVPEGDEYAVYVAVLRQAAVPYVSIERFSNRLESDVKDYCFLDNAATYDGRNTDETRTMTLSGGTTWDHTETLTLTCSVGFFVLGDIGNEIHFTGSDGIPLRFEITGFTSATVVTGKVQRTVPVAMRSTALSDWAKAVDELSNLNHLEGKSVAVYADGYVIHNPNNPKYGTAPVVSSGAITLDKCFSVIHVGLPFVTDLETLDIDTVQSETLIDKKKFIAGIAAHVNAARGLFFGIEAKEETSLIEGLTELKIKEDEDYNEPVSLNTAVVDLPIEGNWNTTGKVLIRQVDPLPMTILSVAPTGLIPIRG